MENSKRSGKLYGVGVGPGASELLTLKAVRVIENADVIIAPAAKEGGSSIALDAAREFIGDNAEVIVKHFPMGGEDQERKIGEAYKVMEEKLLEGKNVAFLTIGDPFVFSTYIYLLRHMEEKNFQVETVPGITSFCASASLAGETLVIGDEPLLILPASRVEDIKDEKYVVIMKLYRCEEKVLDFLEGKGFQYVCVKRAYREGQMILKDRKEIIENRDYMSLLIAHRK